MTADDPIFPEGLALVHPSIPDVDAVADDVKSILASGMLTNGAYVRRFEEAAQRFLGVRNCVAVASCTQGLMLVLRATGMTGEVIIPSFTFAATAHAVQWNGLTPVFADIDPLTLTMSPESAEAAITSKTSAIMATHLYGTPCDTEGLQDVADRHGLSLFFDAAHAFGSTHGGVNVGNFGTAEVFSLSPTKVLIAGEGGIVATDDDDLAYRLRVGRDYGNPGDYDCLYVGLNARMSEFHAALGLRSLETLPERIERRNELAEMYRQALGDIPGISFPSVGPGDVSTYKDFTIVVDADVFGMDAASLASALKADGIDSRRYYFPPVHEMKSYAYLENRSGADIPVTERVSRQVLTLPLWTDMSSEQVKGVAKACSLAYEYA